MIGPLRDVRQRIPGNEVLFTGSNEADIHQKSYCVNAEEGYKSDSVGTQIAEMLATHLRKRGALRAVSVGARVEEAYYLTGTLRRYYGAQESTAVSPTTGILFGAVGAAVAASATPDWTRGVVAIEVTDLSLHDDSGRLVARLPEIRYQKSGMLRAGPDCLVVYRNVNEHLKTVFGDYAYSIEAAVANSERAKTASIR